MPEQGNDNDRDDVTTGGAGGGSVGAGSTDAGATGGGYGSADDERT